MKNGLVNEEGIQKCLQYVEDSATFRKLVKQLSVTTELIGYDKYFEDDKEERNIYKVTITRRPYEHTSEVMKDFKKKISFKFGDSIADTQAGNEPDLYDVLTIASSEFFCPETFEDFCSEFGYEIDSRKALKTFKALEKQSKKLHTIFSEEEAGNLPH